MQPANTGIRDLLSLCICSWISKKHALSDIALHLPNVTRVRFRDVHDIERDLAPVFLIQLIERGNLPAKRWSSITAKDQRDGSHSAK